MLLVATSNTSSSIVVTNINRVKSVETSRISAISKWNKPLNSPITFTKVSSIAELELTANKRIEFQGTLTGYGPDCVGCSGKLGCPPYQNVQNGNIYYQDETYGQIRILAADPSIPCGSIIKIANYNYVEGDFYGIVLDRGSDIHGLTMDLLFDSEQTTRPLGRAYNINFQIERWGF